MGSEGFGQFHPAVREWFRTSFAAPTPAQAQAWPAIKTATLAGAGIATPDA